MKRIQHILILLLLLAAGSLRAQIYPIQATTQLVPPYAVYLPDYATGINNQLRVLLLNKDVTQPDYKVKLVMSIELNGTLIMRTSDAYAAAPITLQPNTPFSVEGLELAPYMNSNNIDFIGYSRQDYEQKKGLPEGSYKICFTAYDYYRPDRVKVSNDGCSFYYLTKNDPPFVNMPACGELFAQLGNPPLPVLGISGDGEPLYAVWDPNDNLIDFMGEMLGNVYYWSDAKREQWYTRAAVALENTLANSGDLDELRYAFFNLLDSMGDYANPWLNGPMADWATEVVGHNEGRLLTRNKYKVSVSHPATKPLQPQNIKTCKAFCAAYRIAWSPVVQAAWDTHAYPMVSQYLNSINSAYTNSWDYWAAVVYYAIAGPGLNYTPFLASIGYPQINNPSYIQECSYNHAALVHGEDLNDFQTMFAPTGNPLQCNVVVQDFVGGNASINFTWTPRHTSSPNTTLSTRYRLEIYQVMPAGTLPAIAVENSAPVFTDETQLTNYTYGPDKPLLPAGYTYAWRVKAFDENGRDWFKNNGYSEVCYFSFTETNPLAGPNGNPLPFPQPSGIVATGVAERKGQINWQPNTMYNGYRVQYRRKDGTGNWFTTETDSVNTTAQVYDLEPNTIYEARVQGKMAGFYGPFSTIDTMLTPTPAPPPGCGLPIDNAAGLSTAPYVGAGPNMYIKYGKFEIQLDTVQQGGGPGYYSGSGRITNILFLNLVQVAGGLAGNANSGGGGGLRATFSNIFINENREVTQGVVYAVSRSLEEWLGDFDEYYKERREEEQQAKNKKLFNDLDSNAVMLQIDVAIGNVSFDKQNNVITFTDEDGNIITQPLRPNEVGHDIIIQGKGKDQWVIRPDGTVIKVPGGGLYPGMNKPVTAADMDILKTAMSNLKNNKFTTAYADSLMALYNTAKSTRKQYINESITKMQYINGSIPTGNMQYTDIVSDSYTGIDSTFGNTFQIQLDNQFISKEIYVNQLDIFNRIRQTVDNPAMMTMLAQLLKVGDKSYLNYVKEKTAANIAVPAYIRDVENALIGFCNIIVKRFKQY